MRILLSNDDGIYAEGLQLLAQAMRRLGEVTVVAPDRDHSGASHALTLTKPLHVQRIASDQVSVEGTPCDCVHLAVTGLFSERPDLVVSGINKGANLGDDVLYSGTVAAALEGRVLNLPAFAFSLVGEKHFDVAADIAFELVARMIKSPLMGSVLLNVNIPDRPREAIRGFAVTRLGHRHIAEPALRACDPRGREIFWIGPAGPSQDAGPGTDFHAIEQGFVSITPIQADMTQHLMLNELRNWIS